MRFGVVTFGNIVFETDELKIKFQAHSSSLTDKMRGITPNPDRGPQDEGINKLYNLFQNPKKIQRKRS